MPYDGREILPAHLTQLVPGSYSRGTLTLNRSVDVSDGGEFTADVGDHIFINANINADSSVGGGFGGLIDSTGGDDGLGGVVAGGNVDVNGAALLLRGSNTDQLGGDGGELDVFTMGRIRFFGAGMAIRADAGTNFGGSGGRMAMGTGSDQ